MNKAKHSLKENLDNILANLPKELHEDFKKELDGLPDTVEPGLSGDAEISAIKAELVANPSVDESAASAELKEIKPVEKITPATDAEVEAQQAAMLAEMKK